MDRMMRTDKMEIGKKDKSLMILFCLIMLFSIVSQCLSSNFLTPSNLIGILRQSSHILAVGLTFVLLTGGMDLSTGYGVTLGAIVIGLVFTQTGQAGLSILCGIGVTLLLGLCNGLLITKVKVVPFVTTLATMSLDPEHHLGGKETTAEARAVQLFWKRADHKDPGLGDRHVLDLWDRGSALILYPVWEQYICLRLK